MRVSAWYRAVQTRFVSQWDGLTRGDVRRFLFFRDFGLLMLFLGAMGSIFADGLNLWTMACLVGGLCNLIVLYFALYTYPCDDG